METWPGTNFAYMREYCSGDRSVWQKHGQINVSAHSIPACRYITSVLSLFSKNGCTSWSWSGDGGIVVFGGIRNALPDGFYGELGLGITVASLLYDILTV